MKNGRYEEEDRVCWYKDGKLHREDGPAIKYKTSYKAWFIHGLKSREDGPAVEWADGGKEWWLNGVEYTEEKFNHWLEKKKLNEKLHQELEEKPKQKKNKL